MERPILYSYTKLCGSDSRHWENAENPSEVYEYILSALIKSGIQQDIGRMWPRIQDFIEKERELQLSV
jgi:hypothetical protein